MVIYTTQITKKANLTLRGMQISQNQIHQGGFSCPVITAHRHKLSGSER